MTFYVFYLAIALAIAFASALKIDNVNFDINQLKNIEIKLNEEDALEFLNQMEKAKEDENTIQVNVNEYVDKILEKIGEFCKAHGLDPIGLPDVNKSFLGAKINLSKGSMNGISTIDRSEDALVEFTTETKKLDILVPIKFDKIAFQYNYHVSVFGLGPTGGVEGKINDFHIHLKLGFDFNTYHASVDDFNVKKTGHIDVKFTGHGLIDKIVTILTEFCTTILKPLLVGLIQKLVEGGVHQLVDTINKIIDQILHPTTASVPVSVASWILS